MKMSREPLQVELLSSGDRAGVATIVLDQPGRPVVVLEAELIDRLDATLDALPEGLAGVVLASASERVFVAGADLKGIREWNDATLDAYLANAARVFGRLASLPCPTAAAINGAALGGGLELAMHCDALIAAPSPSGKPYPIGLPEAGLGLCPGWGGTNLLPARIDPTDAIRRTASGTPMKFGEARDAGMFDLVVEDPSELRAAACAWVLKQPTPARDGAPSRWIGAQNTESSRAALSALREEISASAPGAAVADAVGTGLASGWAAALDVERTRLVQLRHTEDAKSAIDAFFAKSAKA